MFFTIIKLTTITIKLDILFKIIIYFQFDLDPKIFPNTANKINHIHEIIIVEILNKNFSEPE